MLLALTSAFGLSQAFRTVAAILAPPLAAEFRLTPQDLGVFAGAFHFAFGSMQFLMGLAIDVYGVRRTILGAFPIAMLGAVVSATASSFPVLVLGQVLTGIGCAPAFLVCTVFIASRFTPERFAAVSGAALGIGGVGLLLTGTPLAWIVERYSWRAGLLALAACCVLAWAVIFLVVKEAPRAAGTRPGFVQALKGYGPLLRMPHTAGIVLLALNTYASFLAVRGLWLGPMLIERHGFSLVQSGNVALAVSILGMVGPPLFGRLDPGVGTRRAWILGYTLLMGSLYALMAFSGFAWLDVLLLLATGLLSGYMVLQYADVRNAYPPEYTGRAMAVFTMSMFLGVALMQWLTGIAASLAMSAGSEPYRWVFLTIGALLASGAAAYRFMPGPPRAA